MRTATLQFWKSSSTESVRITKVKWIQYCMEYSSWIRLLNFFNKQSAHSQAYNLSGIRISEIKIKSNRNQLKRNGDMRTKAAHWAFSSRSYSSSFLFSSSPTYGEHEIPNMWGMEEEILLMWGKRNEYEKRKAIMKLWWGCPVILQIWYNYQNVSHQNLFLFVITT